MCKLKKAEEAKKRAINYICELMRVGIYNSDNGSSEEYITIKEALEEIDFSNQNTVNIEIAINTFNTSIGIREQYDSLNDIKDEFYAGNTAPISEENIIDIVNSWYAILSDIDILDKIKPQFCEIYGYKMSNFLFDYDGMKNSGQMEIDQYEKDLEIFTNF